MSDDSFNFHNAVGQVTPIKRPSNHAEFKRTPKTRHARKIESQHDRELLYRRNDHNLAVNLDGLNEKAFQAMQAQRIAISRTLDLHGMFVDEALRLLADKLSERTNRRVEYWVVVHGKGKNSPVYDRAPLKDAVLDFLLTHAAVKALTTIKDKDQRSGAVMIAVKRRLVI